MSRNMRVNLVANTSQFKSAMTESSNQIKLLNSEFRSAAAETDQYGNRLDQTSAKKKQLNGVIEQYRLRVKAITDEQKHWTSELEKGNITEEEHAQKQQELARRLNNTEAEMKRYEGQLKRLKAEGKSTRMTFGEFDKKFRDIGKTMRNVGAQVGITAGVGFMAMKRVLGDVVEEAKSFYAGMSEVQAISGATGDEIEKLTEQAKELGRTTVFTAQEANESMANLARAGFGVNEIYDAMPGLLDLAASSKLELASAASITSNVIRGFGFEADKAGRVADVLAKASATANTDVQGLGESMKTAGPVANSLGIEFESVAAATGLMSDAGIDGSQAGRMLRQGMLRLSKPTGEAGKQLKKMKVNAFEADGSMKSLDEVVGELEKGLKGQTKQQKASALATIFGSQSTAGWTVLLEKGSKSLKDYTVDLENSEGAAKDMADVMQDNAEGAIIRMQSALDGLKLELGEKLLPILAKGADVIGDFANKLAEMDEETITTIAELALLATGVLGVTTVVAGLATGIGALMAFAGPIGLAIVGGTALLGGLAAMLYKSSVETRKLKEEQEIAKQEAVRYGEGLSEGTRKGVQGYNDLYEGAKIKLVELRTMSGEEAEKTVKEVQKAFSEMADTVVAELEMQRDKLTRAIEEIYSVAGEHGKEAAEELISAVAESFDKDIAEYRKASETVREIIEEHGSDISKYPDEIREAYNEAWRIMEQGSSEFAKSQEEIRAIQKNIRERQGKIMADEAEGYLKQINETYQDALTSTNDWYVEKTEIIDQALAQDRITYDEHAELMKGVEAGTNQMFAEASLERDRALGVLAGHLDERGKLLDVATGEEFEREKVFEQVVTSFGSHMIERLETDKEYLDRWREHNEEIINSSQGFSQRAKDAYESSNADFIEGLVETQDEAVKVSKELSENHFKELEKDIERAKKAGEDKGTAFVDGIESTKEETERVSFDIRESSAFELSRDIEEFKQFGQDKGKAHKDGLDSTKADNDITANAIRTSVTNSLSKTTDGGGGKKAGLEFKDGIFSYKSSAYRASKSVSESGEQALKSTKTQSIGSAFARGFETGIQTTGSSVWNRCLSIKLSHL